MYRVWRKATKVVGLPCLGAPCLTLVKGPLVVPRMGFCKQNISLVRCWAETYPTPQAQGNFWAGKDTVVGPLLNATTRNVTNRLNIAYSYFSHFSTPYKYGRLIVEPSHRQVVTDFALCSKNSPLVHTLIRRLDYFPHHALIKQQCRLFFASLKGIVTAQPLYPFLPYREPPRNSAQAPRYP